MLGPFFRVAANTRQTQVIEIIGTLMLSPDDVIDLMGKHRSFLREVAVLADTAGAALNRVSDQVGDRREATRMVRNAQPGASGG